MAKWAKQSGVTFYTPLIAQYMHERTRKWYCRFERANAAAPLSVKVYATPAGAGAGDTTNSGAGSVAVTGSRLKLALTAGPQAPSLAGANLYVQLEGDTALAIGTAIWMVDLGKMVERAQLWMLRAFSKISTANGYFTNFARIERGLMTFDQARQARLLPYLGVANTRIDAKVGIVGGAPQGSMTTTIFMTCAAYDNNVMGPDDTFDSDSTFMYHDLRRALNTALSADGAYGGLQDDGQAVVACDFNTGEPELGMEWARDKGLLYFEVGLTLHELGPTEVSTG
jgi:hypothetical protein